MTDNEIIKAYGCCNLSHNECGGCDNCPCKIEDDCIVSSGFELEREVFNLLNRQQAEIERLTERNFELSEKGEAVCIAYKTAKAEAIKEFEKEIRVEINKGIESNRQAKMQRIDRFNEKGIVCNDDFCSYCDGKIHALCGIADFIYNLVKEMVGDAE